MNYITFRSSHELQAVPLKLRAMVSRNTKVFWNCCESKVRIDALDCVQKHSDKTAIPMKPCTFVMYIVHLALLNFTTGLSRYLIYNGHTLVRLSCLLWRCSDWCWKSQAVCWLWQSACEDSTWSSTFGICCSSDHHIERTWEGTPCSSSSHLICASWPFQLSRWIILGLYVVWGRL